MDRNYTQKPPEVVNATVYFGQRKFTLFPTAPSDIRTYVLSPEWPYKNGKSSWIKEVLDPYVGLNDVIVEVPPFRRWAIVVMEYSSLKPFEPSKVQEIAACEKEKGAEEAKCLRDPECGVCEAPGN